VGRLVLAALVCGAASGCIDWGSLYEGDDDASTGDPDAAPDSDVTPNPVGCSDGSAESLLATTGLAACAGAWTIPGVVLESEPACDRAAGNDGRNPFGEGCNVADLCAVGWHVCRDASDVSLHGGEEACRELAPPSPDGETGYIYLTRQRGGGDEQVCTSEGSPEAADDAWGCGTIGLETVNCSPLDRHIGIEEDGGACTEPFNCGEDPSAEGLYVTKSAPEQGGGVLCCSD
jgi:hypothetical protein